MQANSNISMKNYVFLPFIWLLALLEFTNAVLVEVIYDTDDDNCVVQGSTV